MSRDAQERYDARMAYKLGLKLNRKTDADIIAALEAAPNKQALVKQALRGHQERSNNMTKIEIKTLAEQYNMEILRDPITDEAHGVYCDTETLIPELDDLANKVDWHDHMPGQVVVERQLFGTTYRYSIHCPTSWFDLGGWKD